MATPKEIVDLVSRVTGISAATVTIHDRTLMVSGIRTAGKRGHGISNMTIADAANLLVATIASRKVKDTASTVHRFSGQIDVLIDDIKSCVLGSAPRGDHRFEIKDGEAFWIAGVNSGGVAAVADFFRNERTT